MFGSHVIKTWSTTQAVIALSSGEAEYYALVKGASIGFGITSLIREMGADMDSGIRIHTDASAAKGIASRRGLGKVRHIEVTQLWVQEKVQRGEIEIIKINTKDNLADALTKHVDRDGLNKHMSGTGQAVRIGRHEIMPERA